MHMHMCMYMHMQMSMYNDVVYWLCTETNAQRNTLFHSDVRRVKRLERTS